MIIPNIENRSLLPNPAINSGVIYYITLENIYLRSDGISWNVIDSNSITQDIGIEQPLTDTELRATPVPVSGTVTATIDTTGLATSANQTDGTQKTQIVGLTGDVTTIANEQYQYDQIDLFEQMLNELKEINKTLKKIYQ